MQCYHDECTRPAVCKKLCDKHYRRLKKNGSIYDSGSRTVHEGDAEERFHKKYRIDDGGCWIWEAGTRPNGKGVLYGRHWDDEGKSIGSHRFSYQLHIGRIPKGEYVCHKCDTPLCVNPGHLFIGTHHENMADMVAKGRSDKSNGEEKHGRAKLTNAQALKIRQSKQSSSTLAKKYGVSSTAILRIKSGETYPCN